MPYEKMKSYYRIEHCPDMQIKLEEYLANYMKWLNMIDVLSSEMELQKKQFLFKEKLILTELSNEDKERFQDHTFVNSMRFKKKSPYSHRYLKLITEYNIGLDKINMPKPIYLLKPMYPFRYTLIEYCKSSDDWYLMVETKKYPLYKNALPSITADTYQTIRAAAEFVW